MELESVRALKQQALATLIAPAMVEALHARAFAAPTMSLRARTDVVAGIALGVTRGGGRRDFRLAVRLQDRALEADASLRDRLRDLAKGEIETRYVGRAAKLQAPWYASRQRPLLIGASVGHFAVTAGTIGAFPTHRKTGKRILLSNNHVLANENKGKIGDAILQAGALDGGVKGSDTIGALLDFVPLKASGANVIDAAIATVDDAVQIDHLTLTDSAPLKGLRPTPFDIDEPVFKIGRTTGASRGKVTAIEVDDVVVDYEMGQLRFDRQTEIEGVDAGSFSDGGDSGALVTDAAGLAAGLLFAGTSHGGSNGQGLSYAGDLSFVLNSLDLMLDV